MEGGGGLSSAGLDSTRNPAGRRAIVHDRQERSRRLRGMSRLERIAFLVIGIAVAAGIGVSIAYQALT